VERKHGKATAVWIFDRGVVSEENLVAIRKARGPVSGGHRAQQAQAVRTGMLKDDFENDPSGKWRSSDHHSPGGEETYILCRTAGRKEREKAIRSRLLAKIEKALAGLEKRIVEGKLKDATKCFCAWPHPGFASASGGSI